MPPRSAPAQAGRPADVRNRKKQIEHLPCAFIVDLDGSWRAGRAPSRQGNDGRDQCDWDVGPCHDVSDAAWLAQLGTHGLVRGSSVPGLQ